MKAGKALGGDICTFGRNIVRSGPVFLTVSGQIKAYSCTLALPISTAWPHCQLNIIPEALGTVKWKQARHPMHTRSATKVISYG